MKKGFIPSWPVIAGAFFHLNQAHVITSLNYKGKSLERTALAFFYVFHIYVWNNFLIFNSSKMCS